MATPILIGKSILPRETAVEVKVPGFIKRRGGAAPPLVSDQKYTPEMFWPYMDGLRWYSNDEGKNYPHRSHAGIPENHVDDIKADAKTYAEALLKKIDESKILANDPSYAGDRTIREILAYHIVAKGKIMYNACITTPDICMASVGVENDLIGFLSF